MNLIVACDQYGIIGDDGKIPWNVPEDMAQFKNITLNNIVVMGRKTFESLPNGKLKDRVNIVITTNQELCELHKENEKENEKEKDLLFVNITELINLIHKINPYSCKKVFIIGGSNIYKQLFDYCNELYITYIYRNKYNGDTFLSVDYKTLIEKNYKLLEITNIAQSSYSKDVYLYQFAHYIKILN
jgi:dihydrofolate reductase